MKKMQYIQPAVDMYFVGPCLMDNGISHGTGSLTTGTGFSREGNIKDGSDEGKTATEDSNGEYWGLSKRANMWDDSDEW